MKRLLRWTRVIVTVLVSALTAVPSTATAARFIASPAPVYQRDGTGPFTWRFTSTGSGIYSGVAWTSSDLNLWNRCKGGAQQVTMSNLQDGSYSVSVANDLTPNLGSQILDGFAAACRSGGGIGAATTPGPPEYEAPITASLVVDSIPPTAAPPRLTRLGRDLQMTVAAIDAGSGIAEYRWTLGDGVSRASTTPDLRYTYLAFGSYQAAVTVVDRAGNETRVPFVVELAAPPTASPPPQPSRPSTSPPSTLRLVDLIRRAIFRASGRPGAQITRHCTPLGRNAYHCRLAWRDDNAYWRGSVNLDVEVSTSGARLVGYRFTVRRALRSCATRKPLRSCWKAARL